MNWAMVVLGALVGAPLRFLVDRTLQSRHRTAVPWGTAAVNLAACAGLGLLTGAATVPDALQHLIGPGLCATLSTYSTFSYETLRLTETGAARLAAANVAVSTAAGLAAAWLGSALAQAALG